jgi:hypothetical protein
VDERYKVTAAILGGKPMNINFDYLSLVHATALARAFAASDDFENVKVTKSAEESVAF